MKDENGNNPFNNEPGNFGLPEGYFQKSAGSIFNKIEWQEEHKEFQKLLELKNKNTGDFGFDVPQGYFSKRADSFEDLQYPGLAALKRNPGFEVPKGYFEEAEVKELSNVFSDQTDELLSFSTLKSLPKYNHFKVKEGFFEENEKEIKRVLNNPPTGRVVNLFGRRMAFAAAAVFMLSLGFWIYDFYFKPVELKDCGTMACVDKQDLVKTKNLEGLDNDDLYELVNPADLEKKLETKENTKNKETKDSSLKNVSTEDLLDEI